MTITVTPDVAFEPPRNEIEVAVPVGDVMTAVSVWRNDSSGRHLVREQPSAGFDSRLVYDYEMPYGVAVTYDWTATYFDPDDLTPTLSEPFSSWPGSWTGATANGSVSANRLTLTSSAVNRTVNYAWDSITIDYLETYFTSSVRFTHTFAPSTSTLYMYVQRNGSGYVRVGYRAGGSSIVLIDSTISADDPFTISRDGSVLTLTGNGPSATANYSFPTTFTGVRIEIGSGLPSSVVGAITAETYADTFTLAEESDAATISPEEAWLIAPQAPGLSVRVSSDPRSLHPQVRDLAPVNNGDRKNYHEILGTGRPVTTTSGPAGSDETRLTIRTRTREQELALVALHAPQVPVLIRFPPGFGYDFTDDYYSIGTLERSRAAQIPNYQPRLITLPLRAVESPEVDVENPGWSWAQLATEFATWAEVKAAFATWADVAANNRNPGF